LYRRFGSR